jgi:hypothetical protein
MTVDKRDDLHERLERLNRGIAAHHEELGRALQEARDLRQSLRDAQKIPAANVNPSADTPKPSGPPAGD